MDDPDHRPITVHGVLFLAALLITFVLLLLKMTLLPVLPWLVALAPAAIIILSIAVRGFLASRNTRS